MSNGNRATACLFGVAVGDCLGYRTENIRDLDRIQKLYPPCGPRDLWDDPVREKSDKTYHALHNPWCCPFSDDTQMSLSVACALLSAPKPYAPDTLGEHLIDAYIAWYDSPLNSRGPGRTCLKACEALANGKPWVEATVPFSKGCGTNMRVAPVALLPGLTVPERCAIAQFQGALTHGHPTGLTAADLTMYAIYALRCGETLPGLVLRLRAHAEAQRHVYHEPWLGRLWERFAAEGDGPEQRATLFGVEQPSLFGSTLLVGQPRPARKPKTERRPLDQGTITSGAAYIAYGWDEMTRTLDDLEDALAQRGRLRDPSDACGEGWAAEEALGTALYCLLSYPGDGVAAVRYAAASRGDSDSIASITGALAGAAYGLSAWPAQWLQRVEGRDLLRAFGAILDGA